MEYCLFQGFTSPFDLRVHCFNALVGQEFELRHEDYLTDHPRTKMTSALVVLLKERNSPQDLYSQALEHFGYRAFFAPVLNFSFCNEETTCQELCKPEAYSGLISTSIMSLKAMEQVSKHLGIATHDWKDKPLYVVGEATAQYPHRIQFF